MSSKYVKQESIESYCCTFNSFSYLLGSQELAISLSGLSLRDILPGLLKESCWGRKSFWLTHSTCAQNLPSLTVSLHGYLVASNCKYLRLHRPFSADPTLAYGDARNARKFVLPGAILSNWSESVYKYLSSLALQGITKRWFYTVFQPSPARLISVVTGSI
jgi:hypothetical protein